MLARGRVPVASQAPRGIPPILGITFTYRRPGIVMDSGQLLQAEGRMVDRDLRTGYFRRSMVIDSYLEKRVLEITLRYKFPTAA